MSELLPHFTSRVVRTRPWLFAAQTQITTGTLQVKGSRPALSVVLFILDLLLAVEVLSYGIGTAVGSSRLLAALSLPIITFSNVYVTGNGVLCNIETS